MICSCFIFDVCVKAVDVAVKVHYSSKKLFFRFLLQNYFVPTTKQFNDRVQIQVLFKLIVIVYCKQHKSKGFQGL